VLCLEAAVLTVHCLHLAASPSSFTVLQLDYINGISCLPSVKVVSLCPAAYRTSLPPRDLSTITTLESLDTLVAAVERTSFDLVREARVAFILYRFFKAAASQDDRSFPMVRDRRGSYGLDLL